MQIRSFFYLFSLCVLTCFVGDLFAGHRVLMQGNNKLAVVGEDGEIEWEMKWGGVHDIHVLDNGHIMVQRNMREIVEIDPETKKVVWSYDASKQNGNEGKPIEVHAFQPLANGDIMIAESGIGRIIEINRDGEIQKQFKLSIDNPHPHTDTRLVRKLDSGNYLVCHERDGAVREYDKDGKVVWEYAIPMFGKESHGGHGLGAFGNKCFGALRLENGNTLIATGNGHSVLEVTPAKQIVWQIHQNDLPDIQLAWVTTLEVLPNGNYVIGNCHAGPRNPLLVEIDPKTREVVWEFDKFDVFGNSAPNSVILSSEKGKFKALAAAPIAAAQDGSVASDDAEDDGVLTIGDKAPDISIAKWMKGDEAKKFDDGQVYVVEFWATWCGPCLAGMPHISELQHEYGDRVQFIGVSDEETSTVEKFLKRKARGADGTWDDVIKYTIAMDDDRKTTSNYMTAAGRNGIPCAFIVGKDQHIEWIGHPMSIDEPLAAVVGDTWDRAAEGEKYDEEQKDERLRAMATQKLRRAFAKEDWDAALAVIDEVEEQTGRSFQTSMMRGQILEQAGRIDDLLELHEQMVEDSWEEANVLNEVAWKIASADGEKSEAAIQLALKAANQASELTDGKEASVLDTLARVKYEMGELDEAIVLQKKAVALQPTGEIRAALERYEAEKEAQSEDDSK